MLAKLFLLFTLVPIAELCVLIPLGDAIGLGPTLGIILVTAIVGALLGRQQGLGALRRIRNELSSGQLPGESILDGLIILVACTLLVTPGVLTDIVGIALLIPPTRRPVRAYLKGRFKNMLHSGDVTVIDVDFMRRGAASPRTGEETVDDDVIDVTPEETETEESEAAQRIEMK